MGGVVNNCECSDHGQILTLLNISVQEQRNPLRVAEVWQPKPYTYREIVPGHPDRLPGAGRTIAHIYVLGGQAEQNNRFQAVEMATSREIRNKAHDLRTCKGFRTQPEIYFPLRKNVPLAQGIAFFKKRGLQ